MAFFFTASEKTLGISHVFFYFQEGKNITKINFVIVLGNRTLFRPILSVIILVIEQIGLLFVLLYMYDFGSHSYDCLPAQTQEKITNSHFWIF